MKRRTRTRNVLAACVAVVLACAHVSSAQSQGAPAPIAAPISESEIASLQEELTQQRKAASSVSRRRACKSVVRRGEALLKASPAAPNRYRVLGIVLQSQKQLLALENSDRNRNALFDTCGKLAQAPDEYAEFRLEADLLLSEKELSLKNADVEERAQALAELIRRYRNTPGEAKSLMIASQIAPKLEASELQVEIVKAMDERFADHHGVIEFRRNIRWVGRMDVLFSGAYARAGGSSLSFPVDRMGHLSVIVFWSRRTPGFEGALKQIKEQQDLFPDRLDAFSFNLDGLPDGGGATLRALDLNWTVMRLPGGKKSQAFRTYGQRDPVSILVNAYGHALVTPNNNWGRGQEASRNAYKFDDVRISDERYLAQLQSLFIGEFLVSDIGIPQSRTAESIPSEVLSPIQACFTPPPLRYRLTREKAIANYREAEKLCRDAVTKYAKAPDLCLVRNRSIIALMGMWKLAGEPKHLSQAVQEAKALLATPQPRGGDLVARFCLATEAFRGGDADAKSVLSALIEDAGGSDAPRSAVAAAAILALNANSRELHEHYRELLLKTHNHNPALWPVVSFLRDRYHTLHLLKANYTRSDMRRKRRASSRSHLINHGLDPMTSRLPKIELRTLEGGTVSLPGDSKDKLTLLMFVEPPADPSAEFPRPIGGTRAEGRKRALPGVMQYAFEMADCHIRKEVNVIAAFLSDDADRIKALMKTNGWPCYAAMVPGGLKNPLVRQLGILSADRIPNVFLLRRDGTIAWSTSGFNYRTDFGYPFAIRLAMKVHIEVCDTELAYKTLALGDCRRAKAVFSGPFLPEKDERYRWAGPRFHGRALANMGQKDWEAALADIDTAIEAHQKEFNHAREHPCGSMAEMQLVRATILEKLGRAAEAEAARQRAATPTREYPATPYEMFHEKLKKFRLAQQ